MTDQREEKNSYLIRFLVWMDKRAKEEQDPFYFGFPIFTIIFVILFIIIISFLEVKQ